MSRGGDAFDRALEREERIRRRAEDPNADARAAARAEGIGALAFFGTSLLIHGLIVRRPTRGLMAHLSVVALCAAGLVPGLVSGTYPKPQADAEAR